MPCLIITGHPSEGKTTLAHELQERALQHPSVDNVVIINEESACPDYSKNRCYKTACRKTNPRCPQIGL
jgi:tRNA uridine 5-carbamoylmethylation protein Kti12